MKTHILLAVSFLLTPIPTVAWALESPTDTDERSPSASPATADRRTAEERHDSAAYSAVRGQEFMLNGFRSPSIGLEYRVGALSIHAGAYPTIINEGETAADGTTWFAKAGASVWFLPIRMLGNERSSFYAGLSYLNDFDRDGWGHGAQLEAGFRLVAFEGFFARLGASALYAPGRSCSTDDCQTVKVRPNPAIGWGFAID